MRVLHELSSMIPSYQDYEQHIETDTYENKYDCNEFHEEIAQFEQAELAILEDQAEVHSNSSALPTLDESGYSYLDPITFETLYTAINDSKEQHRQGAYSDFSRQYFYNETH